MVEWNQQLQVDVRSPPPKRGLLAFHGVGSGKTVAQAACLRVIQRTCPQALVVLLSSGEILDKNMGEIAEALQSLSYESNVSSSHADCTSLRGQARCCRFPRFFASKESSPGHMLHARAVSGVVGPYGDHAYDGRQDCSSQGLQGAARDAAKKLWLPPLSDTELEGSFRIRNNMLPYMGRITQGLSTGLPRCIALTSQQLENELQGANRRHYYAVDLFNRPVVVMLDEAHEVFESSKTFPALQRFLQTQSSNVCNLFFTATPGSSPANMFALTRSLVEHDGSEAIADLALRFAESRNERQALINEWKELIRGRVHSYHILRDATIFPQLKFVPGVNADNSVMTVQPSGNVFREGNVSDPQCVGQPLSFAQSTPVLKHLQAVFYNGIGSKVSLLGHHIVQEAFETCVAHAHLNDDTCWLPVVYDAAASSQKKLSRQDRRAAARFALRLQGAVMYYANIYNVSKDLFTSRLKPVESCATAQFIGSSATGCPFQVNGQLLGFPLQRLKVYAHLDALKVKQGVRNSKTRLSFATAHLRSLDALQTFCPKMARLVEVVSNTAGKQLVACIDRDYYNIGDALQGLLSNQNLWQKPWVSLVEVLTRVLMSAEASTRSALLQSESEKPKSPSASTISCNTCELASDPAAVSTNRSPSSALIHQNLLSALRRIPDPIYLCMFELESQLQILVRQGVFGVIPSPRIRSTITQLSSLCRSDWLLNKNDGIYNHQDNADGGLLQLVVLNNTSYFTGVNYYGTSAMHIFDPMSFDRIFQFLGRATRMFHRDALSNYSAEGQQRVRGSINVCVYLYLVVPARTKPSRPLVSYSKAITVKDTEAAAALLESLQNERNELFLRQSSNMQQSYDDRTVDKYRLNQLDSIIARVQHLTELPTKNKNTRFNLAFPDGLDVAQQTAFAKEYEEVIAMYIAAVQASVNCAEDTSRVGYSTFAEEHERVGALPGGFSLADVSCTTQLFATGDESNNDPSAAISDPSNVSELNGTERFLLSLKRLWQQLLFASSGLHERQRLLADRAFGESGRTLLQ